MPSGKEVKTTENNDGGNNMPNPTAGEEQHVGNDDSDSSQNKAEPKESIDAKVSSEDQTEGKEGDARNKARERQERFKALQSRAVSVQPPTNLLLLILNMQLTCLAY